MLTINELLIFDIQNEHDSEHDLSKNKNYSVPKIYNANGDIKKRWYVYFSYRNPDTGKLQRLKNIYGIANKYKTKEDRISVLLVYRKTLLKLLKQRYNPFANNTAFYQELTGKTKCETPPTLTTLVPIENKEEISMQLQEAFDFGLKLKEKLVSNRYLYHKIIQSIKRKIITIRDKE